MNNSKIKVILIGYGHIGKRHATVISNSPTFELTAVVDAHPISKKNAPDAVAPFFSSITAFSQSGLSADLAVIATPNGLHAGHIDQCLDLGLDVVAEKPIVLSHKQLTILQQKAVEKGLHLFPVVQNRYAPISLWLQQLLSQQLLGKIYIIQITCLWNRDARYYQKGSWHGDLALDGGSLYTQFLHFVDMLYWLFGQPDIQHVTLQDFNHQQLSAFEDSGVIQFSFQGGAAKDALATMTFSTAAWEKNAESALTIMAENGSIKIGGQYMEQIIYAIGSFTEDHPISNDQLNEAFHVKYGAAAGHYKYWEELSKYYQGEPAQLPTLEEAAQVIDIIEKIYHHNKG